MFSLSSIDVNNTNQNDFTFIPMYFSGKIAEAYQLSTTPTQEVCKPKQIQETKDLTGVDFKTLKLLPEKYKLNRVVDIDPIRGWIGMDYTFGDCGYGSPINIYKGGLQVEAIKVESFFRNATLIAISGLDGQERIDKLSELRTQTFENRTQSKWTENNRFVEINGHLAVIDEPGYTTDRYWYYDPETKTKELLYKEAVTHPGRITFVDEDFEIYYTIKGYFSYNELIMMAKSIQ